MDLLEKVFSLYHYFLPISGLSLDFFFGIWDPVGLLKNAHLLCCAANRTAGRLSIYASRFGFLRASHLNIL